MKRETGFVIRAIVLSIAIGSSALGQMLETRTIVRTNDIGRTRQRDAFEWFSGETVNYNIFPRQNGAPLFIPTNTTPLWYVVDGTLTNYFVYQTGVVVNAQGGPVSFTLSADQSPLPPDLYESVVAIYGGNPTGQPPMVVIDRTQVRVNWSADYRGLFLGPSMPTNIVLDANTEVFANFWTQNADAISQALGIFDAGGLQAQIGLGQTNLNLASNALAAAISAEESARTNALAAAETAAAQTYVARADGVATGLQLQGITRLGSNILQHTLATPYTNAPSMVRDFAIWQALDSDTRTNFYMVFGAVPDRPTPVFWLTTNWATVGDRNKGRTFYIEGNAWFNGEFELAEGKAFYVHADTNEPASGVPLDFGMMHDGSRAILRSASGISEHTNHSPVAIRIGKNTNDLLLIERPNGTNDAVARVTVAGELRAESIALNGLTPLYGWPWMLATNGIATNATIDGLTIIHEGFPAVPTVTWRGFGATNRITHSAINRNGSNIVTFGDSTLIGPWRVSHDATTATDVVNWRTMTSHTADVATGIETARIDADAALSNSLGILIGVVDTNLAAMIAADAALSNAIGAQAAARIDADAALSNGLALLTGVVDTNLAAMIAADAAHSNAIGAESTARIAADAALSNGLAVLTGVVDTNLAAMLAADAALSNASAGFILADAALSNTVAAFQGNLSFVSNTADSAFAWGDHAAAGYADDAQMTDILDRKAWRRIQEEIPSIVLGPTNLDLFAGSGIWFADNYLPLFATSTVYKIEVDAVMSGDAVNKLILRDHDYMEWARLYGDVDLNAPWIEQYMRLEFMTGGDGVSTQTFVYAGSFTLANQGGLFSAINGAFAFIQPNVLPPMLDAYTNAIREIRIYTYAGDSTETLTNNMTGIDVIVSPPVRPENPVPLGLLDQRLESIPARDWWNYPAGGVVDLDKYPLRLGEDWDHIADTNSYRMRYNNQPFITLMPGFAQIGSTGFARIATYTVTASNIFLGVEHPAGWYPVPITSTNGEDWAEVSALDYTSSWPTQFYGETHLSVSMPVTDSTLIGVIAYPTNIIQDTRIVQVDAEVFRIRNGILEVLDESADVAARLSATGGLQIGTASFYVFPSGDIQQDGTNTAHLGMVSVHSLSVTGETGRIMVGTNEVAYVHELSGNWQAAADDLGGEIETNLAAMIAADAALSNSLAVLTGVVDTNLAAMIAADAADSNAIGAEASARIAADAALSNSLALMTGVVDTNLAAMIAADAAHSNAIGAESTARIAADAALSNGLAVLAGVVDTNLAAMIAADSAHSNAIGAESTARIDADAALSNGLALMTGVVDTNLAAMIAADAAHSNAIAAANASISTASNALVAALTNEAGLRVSADNALSNTLSSLSADLGNATNALYGLIDTNLAAMIAADAAFSNSFTALETSLNTASNHFATNTNARFLQGQPPSGFVLLTAWQEEMTNQFRYVETWPTASTNLGALLEVSSRNLGGTNELAIYLPNVLGPGTNGWFYLEGFTR